MNTKELKKQKSLMELLNPLDMVNAIFPYSKNYEPYKSFFFKNGVADWPTWFIIIYRGNVMNDYLLLTICGHADYTVCEYFKDETNIDLFIKDLNDAVIKNKLFAFTQNCAQLGNNKILTPLESSRLVNYLEENKIFLFEPTE